MFVSVQRDRTHEMVWMVWDRKINFLSVPPGFGTSSITDQKKNTVSNSNRALQASHEVGYKYKKQKLSECNKNYNGSY